MFIQWLHECFESPHVSFEFQPTIKTVSDGKLQYTFYIKKNNYPVVCIANPKISCTDKQLPRSHYCKSVCYSNKWKYVWKSKLPLALWMLFVEEERQWRFFHQIYTISLEYKLKWPNLPDHDIKFPSLTCWLSRPDLSESLLLFFFSFSLVTTPYSFELCKLCLWLSHVYGCFSQLRLIPSN